MTANDNIRHYIGDLETREDIDLVFKHIFDLMLANGGEGSGLNADMVDGYHASDFAPASIVDEIEQCIHTIYLNGRTYEGREVTLDILAQDISYTSGTIYNTTMTLQEFLDNIEEIIVQNNADINEMKAVTNLFTDDILAKLNKLLNDNFRCLPRDEDGDRVCYLDANSVNGISFILVTQYQYDTEYTVEQKNDPHNVFIINDNVEEFDDYAPPSVLRAGMDLQFQLNEANASIEYSIDKGKTWKFALPLFATKDANGAIVQKGVINPSWFEPMETYMTGSLAKQEKYPFLLKSEYLTTIEQMKNNISQIGSKWMFGVKLDNDTPAYTITSQNATNGIINLNLKTYLTSWLTNNLNTIKNSLNLPDFNTFEKKANKVNSITLPPQETDKSHYPSAYAVSNSLQGQDNKIARNAQNINTLYNFFTKVYGRTFYTINDFNAKEKLFDGVPYTVKPIDSTINQALTFNDSVTGLYKGSTPVQFHLFNFAPTNTGNSMLTFRRQGNICQARLYASCSMWKNHESSDGTWYDIPLFKFPPGYRPQMGGYIANPIYNQTTNKDYGLVYYKVGGAADNEEDSILSLICGYTGKIRFKDTTKNITSITKKGEGKILLAFTFTYFTKDSLLKLNQATDVISQIDYNDVLTNE